jgi:transcriptional regulator with XRE-family HTH domain
MGKLNDNIKFYRIKKGLTQNELAELLHISKQAVSKWETGRGLPDLSLLPKIASELGVSVEVLLNGKRYHKFLIINLMLIVISVLFILVPLSVSFQRMMYSNVHVFSNTNDYSISWLTIYCFICTFAVTEIACLLYFFGYLSKVNQLPLRKSLIIGLVFHVVFTLFAYLIIWLVMLQTSRENYILAFSLITGVASLELTFLVVHVIKIRKEFLTNTYK